jgi:hypothetical protein
VELTASERRYLWTFAGDVNKSDRRAMIRCFGGIRPHVIHSTTGWNSPDCLSTAVYRDLLLSTVFVPSPRGNCSLDCCRTYEALEAGCIPIVPAPQVDEPFNSYQKVFGAMGFSEGIPFPQVSEWTDGVAFVAEMQRHPRSLEDLRLECYRWWIRYKEHTRACFADRVAAAFRVAAGR